MESTPIMGLSLLQPWASLLASGIKRFETRSWKTDYRGWVAIHASKRFPLTAWHELKAYGPFRRIIENMVYDDFQTGAILAVGFLDKCVPTEAMHDYYDRRRQQGHQQSHTCWTIEQTLGDFSPGRYAWVFRDMQILPHAVPSRGSQGLWPLRGALYETVIQLVSEDL